MQNESESNISTLPVVRPADSRNVCCGGFGFMGRILNRGRDAAMFASLAVAAVGIGSAAYFAGVANQATQQIAAQQTNSLDWSNLPIANATAAVTSEKYSMATGGLSESGEALFVLDHNSGLLQCTVIYPRLGRFMATFTVNVADALGLDAKGGQYIMTTGSADFPRNSNRPVGQSVVYVLDTATGNYACYGVPFDRVALNANRPQQGMMVLISQGTANPVVDRDELR
ncbi:hypothetical protein SAMN06265222_101129 [Neorhodopirellula lusitana]|uniref:Transmembrane protein n=1 Tax=Neorhodopirellula lusitana TaxID=445327 RepID=A0ABY1PRC6_9BACT|nr:hypothetical protein [Neorhodopirellula lusitana]SMP38418.1 hypothetical protein SAMN06265222_101129 [Neorhodopirellula lusitana]